MAIYLGFYGLEREPFGVTPDPDFLFMTPGHREALAQLLYAIHERKGFILLTAEVGMGKTTLLQSLRNELLEPTQRLRLFPANSPVEHQSIHAEAVPRGAKEHPAFGPRHLLAEIDDREVVRVPDPTDQCLQPGRVPVDEVRHDLLRREQIH